MADQASVLIDDFGPLAMHRPRSVAEIGNLVRQAAVENRAIYPIGGGTMLDRGLPPSHPGLAVTLDHLSEVIDYPTRDMTITVQAGITIDQLQNTLQRENQRLPIDVPRACSATLGGILACNISGPRRYGFGTLRDYVIGISVVNDRGQEIKAGGRVVKNVAGYDLCKLFVGSLGTLGIITQVTLKLRPLAEENALITLGCNKDELEPALGILHHSRTCPVCLELLNVSAAKKVFSEARLPAPETPWVLIVGFESNAQAME